MQCGYNADFRTLFEFRGEVGAIWAEHYTQFEQEVTLQNQREDRDQWEAIYNDNPYAAEIDAFASVIKNQMDNPVPGEEGIKNQAIIIVKILENTH